MPPTSTAKDLVRRALHSHQNERSLDDSPYDAYAAVLRPVCSTDFRVGVWWAAAPHQECGRGVRGAVTPQNKVGGLDDSSYEVLTVAKLNNVCWST